MSQPTCRAVQRDQRPPGGRPPQPLADPIVYDTDRVTAPPVPVGLTLATIKAHLDGAVQRRSLSRYAVSGVAPGSRAEIFLLALIFAVAKPSQWGTESDIVAPVDWPPKGSTVAPRGRVTVRFDRAGAATAELIAQGPVPRVAQESVATGVAKLTGPGIGFASVSGWPGLDPAKDAGELSLVVASLELLRSRAPQGLAALAGVQLIRVPSLAGTRAGEFFAGSQVVLGAPADIRPYLKLADRAFTSDDIQFAGGGGSPAAPTVPATFQVILHEVGHALESHELRTARDAYVGAHAAADTASQALKAGPDFDRDLAAAKRKGRKAEAAFYKQQESEHKRKETVRDEAERLRVEALDAVAKTRSSTSNNTKRLQKFVDLVNASHVRPITKYAADNWPGHPEEFYAEAYSLWLVDPTFVRGNYRAVYDFFDSGAYLN